jgi:tetratricopeptide (TPR) repeat protein
MFAPQLPVQQLLAHATQLHRDGNFGAAADVYRQLLRSHPNDGDILDRLGTALTALGQVEEGRRHIERAIKIAPEKPVYHHDLHLTFKREGRMKEARESLQKALRLAPRQPAFTAALAELHLLESDFDGAMRVLEPLRGEAGNAPGVALVLASLAPRYGFEKEVAIALRQLLGRSDLIQANRVKAQFALAYVLDYAGDHDGAWDAARTGNAIRGTNWNRQTHTAAVDAAIAAWTPEVAAAVPKAQVDASFLTLIVGMPRCGSALVGQTLLTLSEGAFSAEMNDLMLAARDLQGIGVTGAPIFSKPHTLTQSGLTEKASTYLNRVRAARPEARMGSDRLPMNFLNLGLLAAMLPGVRVIHVKRDAMDCAVACYMSMFQANYPFMHDPTMLGAFMKDGRRLLDHWTRVLPGLPLLEIAYEDMLTKPEPSVRKIVEFVGVPWTDAALAPARQWVTTITLPDGSMRDLVPDSRVGVSKDYAKFTGAFADAMA